MFVKLRTRKPNLLASILKCSLASIILGILASIQGGYASQYYSKFYSSSIYVSQYFSQYFVIGPQEDSFLATELRQKRRKLFAGKFLSVWTHNPRAGIWTVKMISDA